MSFNLICGYIGKDITTVICKNKLSATLLRVSELDVKLVSLDFIFTNLMGKYVLKNRAKSRVFQINERSQAFFVKI